jgi:hypothetical protein
MASSLRDMVPMSQRLTRSTISLSMSLIRRLAIPQTVEPRIEEVSSVEISQSLLHGLRRQYCTRYSSDALLIVSAMDW